MDDNNINNSESSSSSEDIGNKEHRTYGAPSDTETSSSSVFDNTDSSSSSAFDNAGSSSSSAFDNAGSSSSSAFDNTENRFGSNSEAAGSSLTTSSYSTPSAFSMSGESSGNGGTSTSHQEVFGGQVESASNNYYTNTDFTNAPETISNGFAIASLVMGILSILTCCCSPLAMLFGILGIIFACVQKKDSEGKKPTMATVGLILSIIGVVIGLGSLIYGIIISMSGGYENILDQL